MRNINNVPGINLCNKTNRPAISVLINAAQAIIRGNKNIHLAISVRINAAQANNQGNKNIHLAISVRINAAAQMFPDASRTLLFLQGAAAWQGL